MAMVETNAEVRAEALAESMVAVPVPCGFGFGPFFCVACSLASASPVAFVSATALARLGLWLEVRLGYAFGIGCVQR